MKIKYLLADSKQILWLPCVKSRSRRNAISEFVVLKILNYTNILMSSKA